MNPDLNIQQISTELITPYINNPRIHGDEQVSEIAASIKAFGFVNPILVKKSDMTIIAGHGRYKAAQRMGLEEIPVILIEHLSDNEARALVIADNKIASNSGWDPELLSIELTDLMNDQDIDMGTLGFKDDLKDWLQSSEVSPLSEGSDDAPFGTGGEERDITDEDLLGGSERLIMIYPTEEFYEIMELVNNYKSETGAEDVSECFAALLRGWHESHTAEE